MDKISKQLGKNMKRIRAKKKMSQSDIARALEVDNGIIVTETGDEEFLSHENWEKFCELARVFGNFIG